MTGSQTNASECPATTETGSSRPAETIKLSIQETRKQRKREKKEAKLARYQKSKERREEETRKTSEWLQRFEVTEIQRQEVRTDQEWLLREKEDALEAKCQRELEALREEYPSVDKDSSLIWMEVNVDMNQWHYRQMPPAVEAVWSDSVKMAHIENMKRIKDDLYTIKVRRAEEREKETDRVLEKFRDA